jgi:hypothetical protein
MPVGGAPSGCALGRPRDGSCFSFTGPLAALAVLAPWAASRCSRVLAVVAIRLPVCRGALCVLQNSPTSALPNPHATPPRRRSHAVGFARPPPLHRCTAARFGSALRHPLPPVSCYSGAAQGCCWRPCHETYTPQGAIMSPGRHLLVEQRHAPRNNPRRRCQGQQQTSASAAISHQRRQSQYRNEAFCLAAGS